MLPAVIYAVIVFSPFSWSRYSLLEGLEDDWHLMTNSVMLLTLVGILCLTGSQQCVYRKRDAKARSVFFSCYSVIDVNHGTTVSV